MTDQSIKITARRKDGSMLRTFVVKNPEQAELLIWFLQGKPRKIDWSRVKPERKEEDA